MKMIQVKILGTTVEAALLSPKVAKKYDDGIKKVVKIVNDSKACGNGPEAIEMQCNAVIEFIDNVFGSGSARKVLGEETDLLTCLDAWGDITNLYEKQVNPIVNKYSDKAKAVLRATGEGA